MGSTGRLTNVEYASELRRIGLETGGILDRHRDQAAQVEEAVASERALIPSADANAQAMLERMVSQLRSGKMPLVPGCTTKAQALERLSKARLDLKESERRCHEMAGKVDTLNKQMATLQTAVARLGSSDASAMKQLEAQRARWLKEIDRHHEFEFQRASPQWRRMKREALATVEKKHREGLAKAEAALTRQLNEFLKSARAKAKLQAEELAAKFRREHETTIGPAVARLNADTAGLEAQASELEGEAEVLSLKAQAVAAAPLRPRKRPESSARKESASDKLAASELEELRTKTIAEWETQSGYSVHHLLAFLKSVHEVSDYSEGAHKLFSQELERLRRLATIREARRSKKKLAREIAEMQRTRKTPQEERALRLKKTELEHLLSWMHSNEQTFTLRFGKPPV